MNKNLEILTAVVKDCLPTKVGVELTAMELTDILVFLSRLTLGTPELTITQEEIDEAIIGECVYYCNDEYIKRLRLNNKEIVHDATVEPSDHILNFADNLKLVLETIVEADANIPSLDKAIIVSPMVLVMMQSHPQSVFKADGTEKGSITSTHCGSIDGNTKVHVMSMMSDPIAILRYTDNDDGSDQAKIFRFDNLSFV